MRVGCYGARLLVAFAVFAMLVAGVALGATPGPTSRATAHALAARLLSETVLPPGAVPSMTDPSQGSLPRPIWPSNTPATPDVIDLHGFWRVPGEPRSVTAWIHTHSPAGLHAFEAQYGPANVTDAVSYVGFFLPLKLPAIDAAADDAPDAWLMVETTDAAGGGTAVRADAQVVWLKPRPATERIPAGVKQVTVTVRRSPQKSRSTLTLTTPAQIRAVIGFVNQLPLLQPDVVACGHFPKEPKVDLTFWGSAGSEPLAAAVADDYGCDVVTFQIRGRAEPTLTGGITLAKQLESLLDLRLG